MKPMSANKPTLAQFFNPGVPVGVTPYELVSALAGDIQELDITTMSNAKPLVYMVGPSGYETPFYSCIASWTRDRITCRLPRGSRISVKTSDGTNETFQIVMNGWTGGGRGLVASKPFLTTKIDMTGAVPSTPVEVSSGIGVDCNLILIQNQANNGTPVAVCIGEAGSEQVLFWLPYSDWSDLYPVQLAKGTRISLKNYDGTPTGNVIMTLFN
jgi:hypothetical protein